MEFDRYQDHHKLYILGLISLLFCLSLLFFSLYISPFLIWKLDYQVPDLVTALITFFEESYEFSEIKSRWIVGLLFFIPGLITGYISYYVSNAIDNEIYKSDLTTTENEAEKQHHSAEAQKNIKESVTVGFEIIFLMMMVLVILALIQLFI